MIWRIRDRATFEHLARHGRRTRAGVLWCTAVLDPSLSPPRVAFAIGRAVGPAVVRNRARRQLRAILSGSELPAGAFLIGARPDIAGRSSSDLERDVHQLLSSLTSRTTAGQREHYSV